jgi:hypothetical protein
MNTIKTYTEFLNESNENKDLITMDDLFCESIRRSDAEVMKDAEEKIKNQIARYSELMKSHPEKADLYKAQLDLIHAKQTVLAMKKNLQKIQSK